MQLIVVRLRGARLNASGVVQLHQRDEALVEEARIAARLVPAIRNGDPAAESELVERYSRGLGYLLARKCGDRERARDLLQETFCIAFESCGPLISTIPSGLQGTCGESQSELP